MIFEITRRDLNFEKFLWDLNFRKIVRTEIFISKTSKKKLTKVRRFRYSLEKWILKIFFLLFGVSRCQVFSYLDLTRVIRNRWKGQVGSPAFYFDWTNGEKLILFWMVLLFCLLRYVDFAKRKTNTKARIWVY